MSYQTVFMVGQSHYSGWSDPVLWLLLAVGLGLLASFVLKVRRGSPKGTVGALIAGLIWLGAGTYRYQSLSGDFRRYKNDYAAGRYLTVEGVIRGQRLVERVSASRGKRTYHDTYFTVAGTAFWLIEDKETPCFNDPAEVHEGKRVRIADDHGCILRLEVAE